MNSGFQDKMYNMEVAPPPGIWDKIAAELDESELASKFPSLLYHAEVSPPAHNWQAIAAVLDEPLLINDYAAKLSGIEVAPSVGVWNKIKQSLDIVNAPVVPKRKISPFIRYAAAAAILAFLAWGGLQLFSSKTGDSTVAEQPVKTTKGSTTAKADPALVITDDNIGVTGVDASIEEARSDAALEASKKTYAKLDMAVTRSKIKNASDFFFIADNYEYTSTVGTRGLGIEPEEVLPPIDMATRYVMLMTPDGKIIRMSKKLKELVCCVSGEDEDKTCVDQMKKWRDKMANPSAAHSPGNFMDIVSMVSSLQDN